VASESERAWNKKGKRKARSEPEEKARNKNGKKKARNKNGKARSKAQKQARILDKYDIDPEDPRSPYECPVCMDPLVYPHRPGDYDNPEFGCNHPICHKCLYQIHSGSCPVCRGPMEINRLVPIVGTLGDEISDVNNAFVNKYMSPEDRSAWLANFQTVIGL